MNLVQFVKNFLPQILHHTEFHNQFVKFYQSKSAVIQFIKVSPIELLHCTLHYSVFILFKSMYLHNIFLLLC